VVVIREAKGNDGARTLRRAALRMGAPELRRKRENRFPDFEETLLLPRIDTLPAKRKSDM